MKVMSILRLIHKRLMTKSPLYARIISYLMLALGFIVGLPEFMTMFDIDIPSVIDPYYDKIVSISALILSILSQMIVPNQSFTKNKTDEEDY